MKVGGLEVYPGAYQLLAVLNGEVLDPGVDYYITSERLTFTNAPEASDVFFGIIFGDKLDIGTVSDGSIVSEKIIDSAITTNKIANSAVTNVKIATDAITSSKIQDANITTSKIASQSVTYDKLSLSAGSLPSPIVPGQILYVDGFYYVTEYDGAALLWKKILDREKILDYVDYGDSVRNSTYVIDGTTYDYNDNYMLDSTNGSFTISLNKTPNTGDYIKFVDVTNRWSINNITVDSSGSGADLKDYLDTVDSQLILDDDGWEVLLVYNGTHWKIVV